MHRGWGQFWGTVSTVCVVLAGIAPNAHAFAIFDHRAITMAAFTELRGCGLVPARYETTFDSDVATQNVNQDIMLLPKWLKYSHYYNPLKKLDMRRDDSSVSVREAQEVLLSSRPGEDHLIFSLGRAMHMIQDASTPAHVAPVSHWLNDGFENYKVAMPVIADHGALCEKLAKLSVALPQDLLALLETTALGTLASLDALVEPETRSAATWRTAFWDPSPNNDFGKYGTYGNNFGSSKTGMPSALFHDYKTARLRDSIDATEITWFWFLHQVPN